MKSLLLSTFLSMGVAHTGAFLSVWELPYVKDHFTYSDLTRKLDNVFEIKKTENSLRAARETAAQENYALFGQRGAKTKVISTGYSLSGASSRTSHRK